VRERERILVFYFSYPHLNLLLPRKKGDILYPLLQFFSEKNACFLSSKKQKIIFLLKPLLFFNYKTNKIIGAKHIYFIYLQRNIYYIIHQKIFKYKRQLLLPCFYSFLYFSFYFFFHLLN